MNRRDSVRISAAIMHHPSRARQIPGLVRSCAPLNVQVVPDPDPGGIPSPLRTAKRAWAADCPEATHHLVLQDDVRPCPGFASLLEEAVRARPHHAIALYVNWNSPENSYLLRRAVAAGSYWVPLSPVEYTPTLGLVLPARHSRGLAKFLQKLPDSLRDDDEMVTRYCRDHDIPVLAVIPNLLDHGHGSSLAGNEEHGARHAVIFAGEHPPKEGAWLRVHPLESGPADWRARVRLRKFAVELSESLCYLRLIRSEAGETVDHRFGWYWQDWCELIGLDARRIRDSWVRYAREERRAVGDEFALEVWAAAVLLGADAADLTKSPTSVDGPDLLYGVLKSWVRSGISHRDAESRGPHGIADLIRVGMVGVSHGLSDRHRRAGVTLQGGAGVRI
ncbi:hypothetical protein [Streptomyces sp. sk226]|uniref:hypothetical protein n=1 Tax=Streptomyces sp. sk226 TaxID=2034268 RepID=UPI0011847CF0|nr:hypothetical protein [Streptomyces sp. sk226]